MFALTRKALLATPMLFISLETQAVEADLYNSYSTDDAKTMISSVTCGSTPESSGCYGSATLGPFGQACAMMATGVAKKNNPDGSTTYVRRLIVMDRGATAGAQVKLSFYRETQQVTASHATPRTGLIKRLTLPLVGGPSASCSMAHNASGFYVGTNQSPNAVHVSNSFAVTPLYGFSPPIPVAAITAMQDGHVSVMHKGEIFGGAYVFRNDGALESSGGSELFLAGTQNAAVIAGPRSAPASGPTAASSGTLLDAQAYPVASGGKSVVRDSTGAIVLDGARAFHSVRR